MRSREARAIYTTIAYASISGATFALRQLWALFTLRRNGIAVEFTARLRRIFRLT
jgi:hypothetical protein